MSKTLTTLAALALCGCASSMHSPKLESTNDLCLGYGTYIASPLFKTVAGDYEAEIIRRKLLTDAEWQDVRSQKIRIGMTTCALYASWGRPSKENRTVSASGVSIQHIFNRGSKYIKPNYVYTTDGKVTAWQD